MGRPCFQQNNSCTQTFSHVGNAQHFGDMHARKSVSPDLTRVCSKLQIITSFFLNQEFDHWLFNGPYPARASYLLCFLAGLAFIIGPVGTLDVPPNFVTNSVWLRAIFSSTSFFDFIKSFIPYKSSTLHWKTRFVFNSRYTVAVWGVGYGFSLW